jgi:HAE1 family hydrophobic/amphiphilic exporter-1
VKLARLCIDRPVATLLFWLSVVVAGFACWTQLPIAALPRYEAPTIEVATKLPGASPENIASSVATPLEKQFSAIAGLRMTTSANIQGQSVITLEFDPSRSIDAAAADVQAALFRAARALPPELPAPPSYKKINPADAPVLMIALSSPTLPLASLNAYSDQLVVPAVSSVKGVAEVYVTGQKRYAVRIEANPRRLAGAKLTLGDVAAALQKANSNVPLGQLDNARQMLTVQVRGGLMNAADFERVVVARQGDAVIRVGDVAQVHDSIENVRNTSTVNGVSSVLINVKRQPDANTVQVVDAIRELMPRLQAQMPQSVEMRALGDRSTSIRDAIHDVNFTLLATIVLVVIVMLLFLRRWSATLIPSLSVPVSLLGTFALMQVFDLSLNSISLMGLTIAVGLVVDDAIVVLESIVRRVEQGEKPLVAAWQGTAEVGFTVMSISLSLVAVFIPLFFMPGTIGGLFHEFAIVVSFSILVSAAVALTLIPALVPLVMKAGQAHEEVPRWLRPWERAFDASLRAYERLLDKALRHRVLVLLAGAATLALTGALYVSAPKGFFPQEDIRQLSVNVDAPQDMSYEGRLNVAMQLEKTLRASPYVRTVASKIDHDTTAFSVELKDKAERPPLPEVLKRLRKETSYLPDIRVLFSPVQNLKIGGRVANSNYQYTLQSVGGTELDAWAAKLEAALKERSDVFVGVSSDSRENGLQALLDIDRGKAERLGVDFTELRRTLYAAYGSRQVSAITAPEDTYQVILEVGEDFRRDESDLLRLSVRAAGGEMVPLAAFAKVTRSRAATAVNHQAQLPAVTLSFELAPGKSLSDAAAGVEEAQRRIGLPATLFGSFGGQAAVFQQSQSAQLWLTVIAVAVIYVPLGMLYESLVHPLTILLGLPSAAVGALLALRIAGMELSFIAMIGILLLIGVVKKNAIMMIDFALDARRGG